MFNFLLKRFKPSLQFLNASHFFIKSHQEACKAGYEHLHMQSNTVYMYHSIRNYLLYFLRDINNKPIIARKVETLTSRSYFQLI